MHGSLGPNGGLDFLSGGEMAGRITAHDWTGTAIGHIADWPQSLRTTVGIMLRSPVPMVLLWGPEGVMIYNDAYTVFAGGRHPRLLGSPVLQGWPEVADFNAHVMQVGLAGGTLSYRDQELTLHRKGVPEPVWMNLDYSPVLDESGRPGGVLAIVVETTDRVLAERRIASETERQRRLFEQAPGFITILHGPEHRFEFVNQAYRRLFGDRDFVGRTVRDVFPELVGQGFYEWLDQVYATGERFVASHVPARLHTSPSEPAKQVFLDFIYEPVRDEAARVTGIFCEGHDVTEAYLAATAVEASNTRYTSVLDAMSEGFIVLDEDYRITEINAKGLRLDGRPASELIGRTHWEVAPASVGTPVEAAYRRAMTERVPVELDHHYIDPATGHDLWLALRIYPVPGGVAAFYRDTSATRRTEAALRASEEKLRTLNETLEQRVAAAMAERDRIWHNSPNLLAVMGFDGYLKAINPAWEATLGFDEATLLALPFWEQVHPDDHAAVGALVERLRRGEAIAHFEDRLRHADGSWRWIAWGLVPEGEVFYAIGRDVTAEKLAAAELEQVQEALRQSQKLESMGQLTGGVAHDFNNLLMPIIGGLDMLQRRVSDKRARRLIDGALQSAERAKTLVQRLLAFARRQPLQPTAVDLPQFVESMADLVASTSGPRVKVVVDVSPELPSVKADPNQLEMAILNLAVNARDAMPDGGQLTIAARDEILGSRHRSKLPVGHYVRLSVSDTGIGMDEATLARAVEPVVSTKRMGKGTGLGLSMVHGLAAQLGGALTIRSKPGVGTSVELWLPIATATTEPPETPVDGERLAAAGTVLLIDDEDIVRASTADMLSDLGYAVVETTSAEEALTLIEGGLVPDVVITDHLMPGMTGTDLARAVRTRWPAMPVLVISGYAEDRGIAPDLPRLTKPFRQGELAASLATLVTAPTG
jgi:PAS domain S-box-containing protein